MAETPARDEASDRCNNPFDAQTSGRIPFPSFDAALANEQSTEETEHQDAGSALDWSIDTLAELKPVTFSPLPQQKHGTNSSQTPRGTSSFFEDEKQYKVLRTPLLATRVSRDANRNRTPPTSSPPMELHRRCRETIERCEAALRERQRKMDKLQVMLPPLTPKSPHQRMAHRATPPSRSTPPRPAKRNRLSTAVTPNSEWKSPGMGPPKWSASPIAVVGKRPLCATPATLHFDAMTPSPLVNTLVNTPRNMTKQSSKIRLSFGLSPITFPSPEQAQEEEEEKSEKPNAQNNEDTLPLSSSEESAVSESEKENGDQQTQIQDERHQEDSSSSHGTSSSAMRTPATKKSVAPARSSVPRQRQQAFMEAMEAEARNSDKRSSLLTPPSSILSLYQEAKRLGMTDPQTQWQYVQTLRQREQKHKHKR